MHKTRSIDPLYGRAIRYLHHHHPLARRCFSAFLIIQLTLMLILPTSASASSTVAGPNAVDALRPDDTSLQIAIVTSPWAVLDHNNPGGDGEGAVPNVFVVEAAVTNTGAMDAVNLLVTLDYQQDPANGWVLLSGECPTRTVDLLAPGAAYHAYWFARYSTVIGATHQYTVYAVADNASPVQTSNNYYGNPAPGKTVKTREFISTGNSGIFQTDVEIVVGVAFTLTVRYDLGTDPKGAIFSPVGNPEFDSGSYRLLSTRVRFYDDLDAWHQTVYDRLYFPRLDRHAENAEAVYVFIAVAPGDTQLCPYTAVDFRSTDKYDQFYCSDRDHTIIHIHGRLSVTMDKEAGAAVIQQSQVLTYTIDYTNTGIFPMMYVWFWDDIPITICSIITSSIDPPPDPEETNPGRVAWYVGTVPAYAHGHFSFAVRVDGAGQELADGTLLINHAFLGINQGSLPQRRALIATAVTVVQAPTVVVSKTDEHSTAVPDEPLDYTLRLTNRGAVAAMSPVVTDVLPADVILSGTITPPPDVIDGRTLVWNQLGPIPAGDELVIHVPVQVAPRLPDGTVLRNEMAAHYYNPAGYLYAERTAADTTTITAPVLHIAKSGRPDPVLTGHLLTYTLYITNSTGQAATNLVITDVVPLSTTYVSCSGGESCVMTDGVVLWTADRLDGHCSEAVSFVVRIDDGLPNGCQVENATYGVSSDQNSFVAGLPVLTTVFRDAMIVQGYTFIDKDGNGFYDGEDEPLQGVTLTLWAATVPVQWSDAQGYYRFRVEQAGPLSVSAALPDGYFRTTAGVVYLDAVLGTTRTVNFGYAPITSTFGVIYGTVFEDGNHDGQRELGENGLVQVTVWSDEAANSPVESDEYGRYTLRYDVAGAVTVTEVNPPLYVSTTPDEVHTYAELGSSGPSPVDFGDFLGLRIDGQVFDDLNANGQNDEGLGLAGAVVTAGSDSWTTGDDGLFTLFCKVTEVPIIVHETNPAGYLSTNAVAGPGMVRVDADTLRIDWPMTGTVYGGAEFGDVSASAVVTVSGLVWDDNGAGGGGLANGRRDGSEPGLGGALLYLSSGLSATTGVDGLFSLLAPANQAVTLAEVNPDGYVSTAAIPGNDAVRLDDDELLVGPLPGGSTSAGNMFGDVNWNLVITVTGYVWDDNGAGGGRAGDGVRNGSEPGLAGAVIRLSSGLSETTGADGDFDLYAPAGQPVTITEQNPPGYLSTGSIPGTDAVRIDDDTLLILGNLPGGSTSYGNAFGDARPADLAVEKRAYPDMVQAGQVLTYTLVYSNSGPADAVRVYITDTLPAEVDWGGVVRVEPSLYGPTQTGQMVAWYTPTLPAGAGGVIVFTVTVDPSCQASLTNRVVIMSDVPDANMENNQAEVTTAVSALPGIVGTVFDDANGNGMRDEGEAGLPGVLVTLDEMNTRTTGPNGEYTFTTVAPGVHTVVEADLEGYFSTTPNTVTLQVEPGLTYRVDFGDAAITSTFGAIYGTVFDDANGNGYQDCGELGLAGVRITLDGSVTRTTDLYGGYTFSVTVPGPHTVVETDPEGYFSTTPNTVTLEVEWGHGYEVDFGDAPVTAGFAALYGTVFYDIDGDGDWEAGELGIRGVVITLDGGATRTTGLYGGYTFSTTVTGMHTVVETDPVGYDSTTPNTVTVAVAIGHGYEVDFGDEYGPCGCGPDAWEDDDDCEGAAKLTPGVWQPHDYCDDSTDWVTFTAEVGDLYTLTTWSWGVRADTILALYDQDMVTLLAENDDCRGSDNFSSCLHWKAPRSGTYFVRASNRGSLYGCNTPYWVRVERLDLFYTYVPYVMRGEEQEIDAPPAIWPTGVISHTCPDLYEVDDTWEKARPIQSGVVQVHSFDSDPLIYAADKDYFIVDLWANQAVTFTVGRVTNTATLLELYDASGDNLNVTGTDILRWHSPVPGRFYLSVTPLDPDDFGCAGDVGYELLMEREAVTVLFLPMVLNRY